MKKENKGITLIALVVTIVILLILAGITIAALTGDNGLIGKTGEAKKQTEISEGLEQLEIAVNQSFNKRGNIDKARLAKNLSKINGLKYINAEKEEINVEENTEIELTAKFKLKGYSYKINGEGKVSYKKEGTADIEDILNSPANYYGKYVTNYNSLSDAGINASEGQKWQIFLADDTNIYLIATNQIHKDYAPLNYNSSGNYNMYFSNILSLYDTNTSGNPSVATILSKLNKQSQYHEWLNTPANLKNYPNQKAVLSMLDTDKWNEYNDGNNNSRGFKNSTYASYVIGGPTVEMFCESYNTTHGGDDVIPKPKDSGGTFYKIGYQLNKKSDDDTYLDNDTNSVQDLKASTQTELSTGINTMHFKCNYWLASPCNYDNMRLLTVRDGGAVMFGAYTAGIFCFRPLVCLNSNVHLVENSDGQTYSLELD